MQFQLIPCFIIYIKHRYFLFIKIIFIIWMIRFEYNFIKICMV